MSKHKMNTIFTDDEIIMRYIPKIAQKIGLQESLVLVQLEYWWTVTPDDKAHFHDERFWFYKSLKKMKQEAFPFWSFQYLHRILTRLEKRGLISKSRFNKFRYDKTTWFTLNFEEIEKLGISLDWEAINERVERFKAKQQKKDSTIGEMRVQPELKGVSTIGERSFNYSGNESSTIGEDDTIDYHRLPKKEYLPKSDEVGFVSETNAGENEINTKIIRSWFLFFPDQKDKTDLSDIDKILERCLLFYSQSQILEAIKTYYHLLRDKTYWVDYEYNLVEFFASGLKKNNKKTGFVRFIKTQDYDPFQFFKRPGDEKDMLMYQFEPTTVKYNNTILDKSSQKYFGFPLELVSNFGTISHKVSYWDSETDDKVLKYLEDFEYTLAGILYHRKEFDLELIKKFYDRWEKLSPHQRESVAAAV